MIDRPTDNTNMAKCLQLLNPSLGFVGLFFQLFFMFENFHNRNRDKKYFSPQKHEKAEFFQKSADSSESYTGY